MNPFIKIRVEMGRQYPLLVIDDWIRAVQVLHEQQVRHDKDPSCSRRSTERSPLCEWNIFEQDVYQYNQSINHVFVIFLLKFGNGFQNQQWEEFYF